MRLRRNRTHCSLQTEIIYIILYTIYVHTYYYDYYNIQSVSSRWVFSARSARRGCAKPYGSIDDVPLSACACVVARDGGDELGLIIFFRPPPTTSPMASPELLIYDGPRTRLCIYNIINKYASKYYGFCARKTHNIVLNDL